jgi:excisionase family DNA binding protein
VAVVRSPVVVVGVRDAAWLGGVLAELLDRGYFDGTPALRDRAVEVCNELQVVANGAQTGGELVSIRDASAVLKCSTATVRRRLDDGTLERVRVGHLVRVRLPSEAS